MAELINPENPFNPDKVKIPKIEIKDEESFRAGFLLFTEKGKAIAGNLLTSKIHKSLEQLRTQNADEEALLTLALAMEKPERLEWALKILRENKQHIQINPEDLYKEVERLVENFKTASNAMSSLIKQSEEVIAKRREQLPLLETRLSMLNDFFRPTADSSKIKKITLLPVDQYGLEDAGSSFTFGKELVIASPIDNLDNFDHEFLHSIINPVVDKIVKSLGKIEKNAIAMIAGERLKQDYGEHPYSLLCEELIRTYNDFVKQGYKPPDFKGFEKNLAGISDKVFLSQLQRNKNEARRCQELGIFNLTDMKSRIHVYFQKYVKDDLRDMVFGLYEDYKKEMRQDKNLDFESFIIKRLPLSLGAMEKEPSI